MDIMKIHTEDTEEISNLAVACFLKDHYFIKMFPEEQERKEKLKEMFQDSICYCSREDGAYGIKKDGCWAAFALFFDYDKLNKSDDKQMRRFFGFASDKESRYRAMREPETSDQNFIKLKAEECGIRSTYLLSIGVDETHRQEGLATKLVKFIRNSFPNNYLISDISNPLSLRLYEKLGFQQSQISKDYYWVSSSPLLDVRNVEDEKIYLAIPDEDMLASVFSEPPILIKSIEILDFTIEKDYNFFSFIKKLGAYCKAVLVQVTPEQLFQYQKFVNLSNTFEEYRSDEGSFQYLIYYRTYPYQNPALYNPLLTDMLKTRKSEWEIISDAYISFPVEYNRDFLPDESEPQKYDKMVLDFRTHFESGIPKKSDGSGRPSDFKERIQRYYLGKKRVLVTEETTPDTYLTGGNPIGQPAYVDIILSIDKLSSCGVASVISLSCPFLLSHLLDSTIRNQLIVVDDDGSLLNFYEYIEKEYKLIKRGTPKAFLSIRNDRSNISNYELSSLLFTETIYGQDEGMGRVIDSDITAIVEDAHGMAQYEYAHGYAYSNIFIQISNSFPFEVENRISCESISLFYIELLMFEESAIVMTNERIVEFLSSMAEHNPNKILSQTNQILTDYSKTIEFWDIEVNYPSSKKSLAMLRNAFRIDEQLRRLARNQEQLQRVFNTQRDLLDRLDSSSLNYILLFFTLLQVLALLVPSIFSTDGIFSPYKILSYLFLIVALAAYVKLKNIILSRSVITDRHTNKRKKRKK